MPEYYVMGTTLPQSHSCVLIPLTSAASLLNPTQNGLGSHHVTRAACACLNLNFETTILFGFSEYRIAVGIHLHRQQRDEVRLAWDQTTSVKIFPRLTHPYAGIYFVPVVANKSLKRLEDIFIVEIHLKPQSDVLYSLKDGRRCYIRQDGADIELTPENVRALAIQRKMRAHSGTIQELLADIERLKRKIDEN